MINNECFIYVIGRGFISPSELAPQDRVYTLDGLRVVEDEISSVTSEYVYEKICVVDAGQQNVSVTSDTRFLYHSDRHGSRLISFNDIPKLTPNKDYNERYYLPVLSNPYLAGSRNTSDVDVEYIARMIATEDVDEKSFKEIVSRCTGEDALALIDMLEFWASDDPGIGWFGRAQVKARLHYITSEYVMNELARIAVLAGYTATTKIVESGFWLFVSYESRPIPGSRPKNEKYYVQNYMGNVYLINAGNKPVLGKSRDRVFYLPTSSTINDV